MSPRILHVIPALWSGAGGVVTRLCRAQREWAEVALATGNHEGPAADWPTYRTDLSACGVQHHEIDFLSRDPAVFWPSVVKLTAVVERWRPDVVHAHAGVPAAGVSMARDRSVVPFKFIAHCYSWGPTRPGWMDEMDLWALARADTVVCSARAYERRLLLGGIDRRRLVYLPWGLPLSALDRARRRHRRPSAVRPTIGCLARIEPRKGQLALCRAFARCHRQQPRLRLDLVGPVADAEYASRLRDFIAKSGLTKSVEMPGRVRDPHGRMASWDLAVSLSSDEGQGLAVLEAMALGVPVLARSSAGIEDFLRHEENGFILTQTTPKSVAAAILGVLATPGRTADMTMNARRLVQGRFDWTETVQRIETLYGICPAPRQGQAA